MKKIRLDNYFTQTIIFSAIASAIVFGYFIIRGDGFFTIVDDFNTQQMTFATAVWNMLHSGDIGEWSWNVDLGSSFINTFSFYNLGSPFFWISLLAPRGVFPYLSGFLYMVKYVVAAATAYLYLKLFLEQHRWCVIGALLYAFSGYQTTNLEFFHFHDVVALFPLLLWGLELAMSDKKHRPVFVFAIFINCLLNYYFFIGEVIFLVIYYLIRYRHLSKRQCFSGLLSCTACGILGVGMAAILFIPSIVFVLGNYRAVNQFYLENLVYNTEDLLHIIKGFLFPGEPMKSYSVGIRQNWSSTSAYLPFFGISLVIAYIKREKKNWLSCLLLILGIIALFPLTESMFLLFTESIQRWWYMLVLLMVLATVKVLEKAHDYPVIKSSLLYGGMLTIYYLMVRFVKWNADGDSIVYDSKQFTLYYVIALLGPIVLVLLTKFSKKNFYRIVLLFTLCCCIATTGITLHYYRCLDSDLSGYKERFAAGLQLETLDEQYRYNTTDNALLFNGDAAGIGAFCTTIENSSRRFDALFGHISTSFTTTKYDVPGLAELLAGKYEVVDDPGDKEVLDTVSGVDEIYYITQNNACPIGFAVDYVLTEDEFADVSQEKKALTLMQAAIVDETELDKLENVAVHVNGEDELDYDEDIYSLVDKTILNKVNDFHRDSHGFSCTTSYDKARLVYFTVPWSEGWEATVDGVAVKVLDSGGMMALCIPEGEHQVIFTYHTPGFRTGVVISLISVCVFIIFLLLTNSKGKIAARIRGIKDSSKM